MISKEVHMEPVKETYKMPRLMQTPKPSFSGMFICSFQTIVQDVNASTKSISAFQATSTSADLRASSRHIPYTGHKKCIYQGVLLVKAFSWNRIIK